MNKAKEQGMTQRVTWRRGKSNWELYFFNV